MKFVTLSAAGALFAGSALAGGVAPAPYEPMPMAPAPIAMPSADWTGGYAGLSLGYATGEATRTFPGGVDVTRDADGVVGGVFAGYQYDFGSFVLGAELDLNAANVTGGDPVTDNVNVDYVHRLKLRAGYDLGSALIYGTAGAAYGEGSFNYTSPVSGNRIEQEFDSVGYVVGAGIDYMVTPNVVVGAEVLYHDFSDFGTVRGDLDADATSVQARVAYKF